ncbi:hypothetical protein GCM10025867_24620 [Frondihabitans sucicola]|uniref:Uncharacterized protein n=1 Tax=Frondihabitans sucicola TaxID=1268041 RepID=A0ABM8GP46_9MICO|nr:hypothetical protein [Frondihabitans sucicola]BDZ50221.1 hypothetical protein GCM10025867_24620 [Frondihabitans sucicola]
MVNAASTPPPGTLGAFVDGLFQTFRVDRLAGGRQHSVVAREDRREHPRTVRAFQRIRWLLVGETVVGLTAVVIAVLLALDGVPVPWAVWFRSTVVLLITLSLYVFAWRAQLGYSWAFARLRLFSRIFPLVTIVVASLPGLYPFWMVVEQWVFSVLMVGIAVVLSSGHLRAVFPAPPRRVAR